MSIELVNPAVAQQLALERFSDWGAPDVYSIGRLATLAPRQHQPPQPAAELHLPAGQTAPQAPLAGQHIAAASGAPAPPVGHPSVLEAFRARITAEEGSDLYRQSLAQVADATDRIFNPFSTDPNITARFLRAVRHVRQQHEANQNPHSLAQAEELQRLATAQALRALAGLSLLQQGAYSPEAFDAVTQPDIPAVRIPEATTSARGLRRFFARFGRHRGKRAKR